VFTDPDSNWHDSHYGVAELIRSMEEFGYPLDALCSFRACKISNATLCLLLAISFAGLFSRHLRWESRCGSCTSERQVPHPGKHRDLIWLGFGLLYQRVMHSLLSFWIAFKPEP